MPKYRIQKQKPEHRWSEKEEWLLLKTATVSMVNSCITIFMGLSTGGIAFLVFWAIVALEVAEWGYSHTLWDNKGCFQTYEEAYAAMLELKAKDDDFKPIVRDFN